MNRGKTMDMNIFKGRLADEQLQYCIGIFNRTKVIKIDSKWVPPHNIFHYLNNFQDLSELHVTIYDDDEFNFSDQTTIYKKLHITCKEQNLYANPVEQIIQHTNPILESFSLCGGYLNEEGILHLMRNNLKSLEFTDTLIRYIYRLSELENLQLANLPPRLHMNSFNEIFEKFQEQTPGLFLNMKRLCSNVKQDDFSALRFFPNLVSLEIFYTVEKGFGSVAELIKSINMHRENRTCNPQLSLYSKST